MRAPRSTAGPLTLAFTVLVIYASLYPLQAWRWPPGQALSELLALPWLARRDPFDEAVNVLGYVPLGVLAFVAALRRGRKPIAAIVLAIVAGAALSYAMEVTQQFLPARVPSMRDWVANAGGAAIGALMAAAAFALGVDRRWQQARMRWFDESSAGAAILLLTWPLALLYPTAVPLGTGQVWDVLRDAALRAVDGVPWAAPFAEVLQPTADVPLSPLREAAITALGAAAPCLVAFTVARPGSRRVAWTGGAAALAVAVTALSTAMNFGPMHALAWWSPRTGAALAAGWAVALAAAWLPSRVVAGAGLACLSALVAMVASAPSDPYYAASLHAWEQGRFVRFHGLAHWVGMLWPYGAMAWLAARLARREGTWTSPPR